MLNLPSGIEYRDQLEIQDATKINAFQTCPRKYFYEFVLGWKPENESIHLIFGEAFHLGLEYLIQNHTKWQNDEVSQRELLEVAFSMFFNRFTERTVNHIEGDFKKNKEPDMAALLYRNWLDQHKHFPIEVMYTEVVGSVPVSETDRVHFKIDAIVKHRELGILNLEHKTAGSNRSDWRGQWLTALQPKVYTHALYSNFPAEEVFGTIINGFICTKEAPITQVLVNETPEMMADFMWLIRWRLREIKHNYERLSECNDSDKILMAFPKNTTSCTHYGTICPYHTMCCSCPNPLQKVDKPPIGMTRRDWDPRVKEEARFTMTEDGITKIEEKKSE